MVQINLNSTGAVIMVSRRDFQKKTISPCLQEVQSPELH